MDQNSNIPHQPYDTPQQPYTPPQTYAVPPQGYAPRPPYVAPSPPAYAPYPAPTEPLNPVIQTVKKAGSSAAFLIMTIVYTLTALLNLVNIFAQNSAYSLYQWAYLLEDPDVYEVLSDISGIMPVFSLFGFIPTLMVMIGLWLFYASCRNRRKAGVSTGGLTMVQVVSVMQLVLICILAALVLIVAMAAVSFAGFGMDEEVVAVMAAMMLLTALMVMIIIYQAKLVGTLSAVRKTASTGVIVRSASGYVAVMNCILAVCSFVSVVLSAGALNWPGLLSNLLNVAFLVLVAVCIFRYNNLMRPYTAVVQLPPMYAAQPPVTDPYVPQPPVESPVQAPDTNDTI